MIPFTVSLPTVACGIGVKHHYAENTFMRALYRFHVYYTVRQILLRHGMLLPTAPNFDPWKMSVDSIALEKIRQEFAVGAEGGLQSWAFNCVSRHFMQDGKTGDYIHTIVVSVIGYW